MPTIVEQDRKVLERIIGKKEFSEELIANYRKARFAADRLGNTAFRATELVLLVVMSGIDPRPEMVQRRQGDEEAKEQATKIEQKHRDAAEKAVPPAKVEA